MVIDQVEDECCMIMEGESDCLKSNKGDCKFWLIERDGDVMSCGEGRIIYKGVRFLGIMNDGFMEYFK